ncbi:MAG: recombination protein O N-terminal domain-containing protein, partial [Gammaproteobacteria bacterium]
MTEQQRIELEPAWVLHHRPFRDSSEIVELFTREHGRVAAVARGSRRPGRRRQSL